MVPPDRIELSAPPLAKAKERGVYKGRKPTIDRTKVMSLRQNGLGPSAIAREMRVGRSSVYRIFSDEA